MSGKLLQAVWAYRGKDLDCTETHILARMAWYASDAGGDIFPSVNTLAAEIKLSRSQLYERLIGLKEKGFITPEGTSAKRTVRYRLSPERIGVVDEFNDMSSRIPPKDTRPETGHIPVRKPDTHRPETGHNRLPKHYIEKHDHYVVKKRTRKPTLKQRRAKLSHDELYTLEKLLRLKGLYEGAAMDIVETHTTAEINNVLELAMNDTTNNPGAYVVKSLYKKEA